MTRDQRKAADKLAAVRTIVDIFNGNCKKCYSVSQFVTLDETLLAFRGRWIFRMYIPNKPNKYRLKVFSVVDAKTISLHTSKHTPEFNPKAHLKLTILQLQCLIECVHIYLGQEKMSPSTVGLQDIQF